MTPDSIESAGQDKAKAISGDALARRRALLKGLGKGAAVLASSVPLKTLASTSVFTNPGKGGAPVIRCGLSGMQSGVHSRETVTDTCGGYSPGFYKKSGNWPSGTNPNATCVSVFSNCTLTMPSSAGTRPATLLEVMNNFESSDEFHWIAAWLNGIAGVFNFPYSGPDVLNLYYGRPVAGVTYTYAAALTFFKTYMELHA